MRSCPACGSLLTSLEVAAGRLEACLGCNAGWVESFSTAEVGGGRVHLHHHVGTSGGTCCQCRGPAQHRSAVSGRGVLNGEYCSTCDAYRVDLSSTKRLARSNEGDLFAPPVETDTPQLRSKIEERDRVFAFLLGLPIELSERLNPWPPATTLLLTTCGFVFALALAGGERLALAWSLSTASLGPLTLWQLVACIFLHVDLVHLLGNAYFLYAFGRLPESKLGPWRMLSLFLLSGLAGSLFFLALHFGSEVRLLGASGAVSGILGFYFVRFPTHRIGLSLFFTVLRVPALIYLGFWFGFQLLFMSYRQDQVAYSAHVGGFLVGVGYGMIHRRRSRR